MKLSTKFFVLIYLCFIVGCMEFEQDIYVNDDGGGKLVYSVGITNELISEQDSEKFLNGADTGFESMKTDPNVSYVNKSTREEDGFTYAVYEIGIKDLKKLKDLGFSKAVTGKDTEPKDDIVFGFELDDKGRLVFKQRFPGAGDDEMGASMAAAMFADRTFTVRLHGHVSEGNGERKEGSMVWELPISDLFKKEPVELYAIVRIGGPSFAWTAIIVVALIGGIAFMASKLGKKNETPANL